MSIIAGIGFIAHNKLSSVQKKQFWSYESPKHLHRCLKENGIVQDSIKDFGRLDVLSKMTIASVALALYDASFSFSDDAGDIGIIGTGDSGSLASNMDFFKDYVDSGRKMGRGNLFVYTLPSTSLAAASIAFGFRGPLFYEMYADFSEDKLLENAGKIMLDQSCRGLVVVCARKKEVKTFFLRNKKEYTNVDKIS